MKNLLSICFLIAFSFGYTQDIPSSFSLQEAINYALENNRQSKNATRDIDAAKQQKWETTATGLPQLDATVNYQNFLKQQVSVVPAEFFGGNPGEFAEVIFGTQQTATATATLNQLLFDGSYLVGLQSAKVFLEISENAKIKTDLEVRKAVINAYGNVLLSEESISILEKNIAVLEKNLDETQKIYENGLEEEESVEQLQITLSNLKSNLNNSKRLRSIAYQMFNITLGIEFNTTLNLTDNLETLTIQNISLETLTQENNVETTIDYKIAANDTKSKELLLKLEKSKAIPRLSAFLNGGYNSFSDDFVFLDSNNRWFGFSSVGVNLNVPIFSSGKRSAATQRAKINLEKSKDDLTETQQRLNLQIETAKSNYKFAIEDYTNKKQNLALAERIEQKNQTKFFEGISSSFELRQAQTQLYSAQQTLLQTMLNVINAKAELETITNKID
ncbi:transporter [Winogradskyella sp. PC-19]|uniref:TolC family protein n=1 Tax=unclassified Winogradskyella TaxID=2615021 RepID=UPI000B3CF304|nr:MULTISPECIES: TolC family protein [unclassified Winogradskyella]ARV09941.1 transporter [Winogradskyella sp. PC-19]RZN84386.1 MAG: TolC family protein [Winogradskyella sp.]